MGNTYSQLRKRGHQQTPPSDLNPREDPLLNSILRKYPADAKNQSGLTRPRSVVFDVPPDVEANKRREQRGQEDPTELVCDMYWARDPSVPPVASETEVKRAEITHRATPNHQVHERMESANSVQDGKEKREDFWYHGVVNSDQHILRLTRNGIGYSSATTPITVSDTRARKMRRPSAELGVARKKTTPSWKVGSEQNGGPSPPVIFPDSRERMRSNSRELKATSHRVDKNENRTVKPPSSSSSVVTADSRSPRRIAHLEPDYDLQSEASTRLSSNKDGSKVTDRERTSSTSTVGTSESRLIKRTRSFELRAASKSEDNRVDRIRDLNGEASMSWHNETPINTYHRNKDSRSETAVFVERSGLSFTGSKDKESTFSREKISATNSPPTKNLSKYTIVKEDSDIDVDDTTSNSSVENSPVTFPIVKLKEASQSPTTPNKPRDESSDSGFDYSPIGSAALPLLLTQMLPPSPPQKLTHLPYQTGTNNGFPMNLSGQYSNASTPRVERATLSQGHPIEQINQSEQYKEDIDFSRRTESRENGSLFLECDSSVPYKQSILGNVNFRQPIYSGHRMWSNTSYPGSDQERGTGTFSSMQDLRTDQQKQPGQQHRTMTKGSDWWLPRKRVNEPKYFSDEGGDWRRNGQRRTRQPYQSTTPRRSRPLSEMEIENPWSHVVQASWDSLQEALRRSEMYQTQQHWRQSGQGKNYIDDRINGGLGGQLSRLDESWGSYIDGESRPYYVPSSGHNTPGIVYRL